jgi:hypothetical protein
MESESAAPQPQTGDDAGTTDETSTTASAPPRRPATNEEFLVPGPTAESNEGLGRWGLSWLFFSLALMIMMLALSFICWALAVATGIA